MTKKYYIYLCLLFLFFTSIIIGLFSSKYCLEETYYKIRLGIDRNGDNLRIVHLSDLHNMKFGYHNNNLISKVKNEKPDVIFITGDLINCHKGEDTIIAENVISRLSKIAPVYISLGNQEQSLIEDDCIDVINIYSQSGATVLDKSYVDIIIKGNRLRIGGIFGYCQPELYAIESHNEIEVEFLDEFQNTDLLKLLLCHIPLCWIDSYSLYDWDIDIVFSGHVHGGQIRLPFVGGIWAPDHGWFPGKLDGVYSTSEDKWKQSRKILLEYANNMNYDTSYYEKHSEYYPSYLVLSRGLGNTDLFPRFNNMPEIVVVDLIHDEVLKD